MQPDGGILFLDIDGVLNAVSSSTPRPPSTHIRCDDDLLERLRGLVLTTGCSIVLTTIWRHHIDYIRTILHRAGLPAEVICGRTPGASVMSRLLPDLPAEPQYESRADEITAWLEEHPSCTRYAVLDASAAPTPAALRARADPVVSHYVQTRAAVGLSEADVHLACSLLAKPDGTYYFWAPTPWAPPAAAPVVRSTPSTTVEGGVCTCRMLGSTKLIECNLCRRQMAERRAARQLESGGSLGSLAQSRGSLRILQP